MYYVNSCATSSSVNAAPVFSATTSGIGFTAGEDCAALVAGLQANVIGGASNGASANWSAITPSTALGIVGVQSSGFADCHLGADGFAADYYYGNNGVNFGTPQITIDCHGAGGNGEAGDLFAGIPSSRYFGWQVICQHAGGCTPTGADDLVFGVTGVVLAVQETNGPTVTPTSAGNLYNQTGWVRGTYPASFSASDPSGVCSMQLTANGKVMNSYSDPLPDNSTWSQCPGSTLGTSIDTTAYADGAGSIALAYTAANAPGVATSLTRAINVDNQTPAVTLSGPTDVSSEAGTQGVTATATAGPSGIAGIECTVDGGPELPFTSATATIPVAGLGRHTVSCVATNRALNSDGQAAQSPTATTTVSIRQPSASAITFAHIADALRCRRVTKRIAIPGKARLVKRHGKTVVVQGRPRILVKHIRQCRARTARRRVTVIVTRHGHRVKVRRVERVVLLPHRVDKPTRTIGHGRSTTVSGFVGLADGQPVAAQPVTVYAAADNGLGRYRPIASVTTDANGEWSATVRPGPSRLLFAGYGGSSTVMPANSSTVRLNVPARIALSIAPRVLPWRGTIRIRGHLVGGYVPPDGVALRLLVRYPGAKQASPLLALRTNRRGSFSFTWSYHAGRGVATYPFSIATTAAESDYPFAASSSRALRVTFGRPTPRSQRHRGRRHRHRAA